MDGSATACLPACLFAGCCLLGNRSLAEEQARRMIVLNGWLLIIRVLIRERVTIYNVNYSVLN